MEALIYPLIVSAAGGLAFLAYKHPKGFPRLSHIIMAANSIAYLVILAYHWGVDKTLSVLEKFIIAKEKASAKEAVEAIQLPEWLPFIVFISIVVYLTFLMSLPSIIGLN
jgi:hypothetical protein